MPMTLAAALLLAGTSISSSQLGQFFTLPGGCPTAVSGRWTPGSDEWFGSSYWRRVTPEVISAVNSTFEAYYERVYNTGGFWSWYTMRDFEPGAWGYFDYSPTNRVVSRRLVEYDNVRDLISEMRTDWRNLTGGGCWGSDVAHPVTSTTANFAPGVRCEVPTARDWSPLAEWNTTNLLITFKNVEGDVLFSGSGRGTTPLYDALAPLRIYPDGDLVALTNRAPIAMSAFMTENFGSYDPAAATNVHRRLVDMPEALAPVNQMLTLSDRTIYRPDMYHYTWGDAEAVANSVSLCDVGEISVTVTITNGVVDMPEIPAAGITWHNSGSETVTTNTITGSDYRYLRVRDSTFAGSNAFSVYTNAIFGAWDITGAKLGEDFERGGVPPGRCEVYFIREASEAGIGANNEILVILYFAVLHQDSGVWYYPAVGFYEQYAPSSVPMRGECAVYGDWAYNIEHNFNADVMSDLYLTLTNYSRLACVDSSKYALFQTIAYTNGSDGITFDREYSARTCLTRCSIMNGIGGTDEINRYNQSALPVAKDKLRDLAADYIGINPFNPPAGARMSQLRTWAHSTGGLRKAHRVYTAVVAAMDTPIMGRLASGVFTPDDPSRLPLANAVGAGFSFSYTRPSSPFTYANRTWSGYADFTSLFWIDWDWQAMQPVTY